MGLGHDINVLYPRLITLEKKIRGFIGVVGLTCLMKLVRFFIFNCYYNPY